MDRRQVVVSGFAFVLIAAACQTSGRASPPALPSSAIVVVSTPSATTAPTETPTVPSARTPSPPATPTATSQPTPGPTASATAAGRWTRVWNQPAFANSSMYAVAASAKRYVAIGRADTGEGWRERGVIWTSTDGRTWRRAAVPSATTTELQGVIHDRLGFIVWGFKYNELEDIPGRAAIWTSPDGIAWQRVPDIPSFREAGISGIARFGHRLVAVGSGEEEVERDVRWFIAWTSDDGKAWTPVAGTNQIRQSPGVLAATDKALVTTTQDMVDVIRSTDGFHWQVVRRPASSGEINDIVASGGRFVAVGDGPRGSSRAWTSTDGRTWRRSVLRPSTGGGLWVVAARGSGYIALGNPPVEDNRSGRLPPILAYRSNDGRTWTKMSTSPNVNREGRIGCAPGPCPYQTGVGGLADGPRGPVAVGGTGEYSYRAVVWVLR